MFGSDNYSPVHPKVLEELARVNVGHVVAYGDDAFTAEAKEILHQYLGDKCDILFTFNGTGANVVCLSGLLKPWQSVICTKDAHINTDEGGAPERIAAAKLIPLEGKDGKLTPEMIEPYLGKLGNEHAAQPHVISISNVTELGTVYSPDEIRALCDFAHEHGLVVHCDGARLANAAASLGVSLKALTADAGLDALSLGGTKNGLMGAEAAVFFGQSQPFTRFLIRKQSAQLASKMRYIAAQFIALYQDDTWLACARHANEMNAKLVAGLRENGHEIVHSPDANEVFCVMTPDLFKKLNKEFHFYVWDEENDVVRLVCSWDTEPELVERFLTQLKG
ncbi:MAG: aminotransferase class I/II-fold pyridoxal phosphate-dependent enzyme [Coriobacteriia bacterium]|nr:aminotransferase class I/II-fold pyridoxal phosphate-dependent enzyme [Coriobacteriia bacterium]